MNKKLLKSKMDLFGDNGGTLSEYLRISRSTLSAKMNESSGREFTQSEIADIKARYNLTPDEVNDIFFTRMVS